MKRQMDQRFIDREVIRRMNEDIKNGVEPDFLKKDDEEAKVDELNGNSTDPNNKDHLYPTGYET